jgi:hypothetical protein
MTGSKLKENNVKKEEAGNCYPLIHFRSVVKRTKKFQHWQ